MTTSTNAATTNWSGAVIQAASGESFSTVSAQWTVPTVSQVPINGVTMTDVASWVGLDGYKSNEVAQAGIQETVTTGANGKTTVSYSAWDEWYPAGSNDISSSALKVDPGETVKITVETTGAGAIKATFLYDDETTGQTDQTSLTAPSGTSLTGNSWSRLLSGRTAFRRINRCSATSSARRSCFRTPARPMPTAPPRACPAP
jgi:hypothetical protein